MKKTIIAASSFLVAVGAFAQGTVNFNNRVPAADPPINAPIFYDSGAGVLVKADGANFMAALYAGPSADALAPIGAPIAFKTGAVAGYFGTSTPYTVDTIAGGADAFVKVVAWSVSAGATYKAAVDGAKGGWGESTVLKIKLGGGGTPPGPPADLIGLTSFNISNFGGGPVIPEPSVVVLAGLGGLALLLRRRS